MTAFAKSMLVGLGGFLGANLRFWLGGWIQSRGGDAFPWGTLAVNASGSFLLGLTLALALRGDWHPGWRLFLGVGVLGGYTTFSTFSHETVRLLADGSLRFAAWSMLGNAALGIGGAWLGIALVRAGTGA